eukprot:a843772_18.p1 GENE.a843772_18~~a843772_18.p1  ORF type:complete len:417 (-),score=126.83 a843772_18:12-1217(-)
MAVATRATAATAAALARASLSRSARVQRGLATTASAASTAVASFRPLFKSRTDGDVTSQPKGRSGHGASRIGHHIFAFGGDVASPPTGVASDDFWSYSLSTNASGSWTRTKGNAGPSARFGHTTNGKENALTITVLGGTDTGFNRLDDHWRFEIFPQTLAKSRGSVLGTWLRLPSMPAGRDWHTSTLVQRDDGRAMITVIGGRSKSGAGDNTASNQVWKFSLTREKWDVLAPERLEASDSQPGVMAGHSSVFTAADNSIVVLGRGMPSIMDERARAGPMEVWRFSLGATKWERVETQGPAPCARAMQIAALVDSGRSIVVFGGCTVADGKPKFLGDMWRLDLATRTWSPIEVRGAPLGLAAARLVDASVGKDNVLLIMGGETPDRKVSMDVWEVSIPAVAK